MASLKTLFPKSHLSDWKLYLEHTLIWAGILGDPNCPPTKLYFVEEIAEDRGTILLKSYDTKQNVGWMCDDIDVVLPIPDLGYYSFKRTVINLVRHPKRQNKKGFCSNTHQISNLVHPIIEIAADQARRAGVQLPPKVIRPFMVDSTPQVLAELLQTKQRFFSIEEACFKINSFRAFARAVSPRFAVSASIEPGNQNTLWYNDIPVGVINGTRLLVTQPMLYQEIMDEFGTSLEINAA